MTERPSAIGEREGTADPVGRRPAAAAGHDLRRDVLLVVLAVAVRLVYWRFALRHYAPTSDAGQYAEIAHNLLHGHGFSMQYPQFARHPTAFRPPVYPLVLAGWWKVFGEHVATGQAMALVTGSATVLLVERLGRRVGGSLAGLVAAVAVAVYVPWVIRNQVQLGAPVMYTSNGFNMAALYSDAAYGHTFVDPAFSPAFRATRPTQVDEVRWDRALRKTGLTGLRHHPLRPLTVVRLNAESWFELKPRNNDLASRLDGRSISVDHWAVAEFYVFTLLGIAGLLLHRNRRATVLLGLVAAYVTTVSLFFIGVPRVRAPFDLICCLGVGLLAARWRGRRDPADDPARWREPLRAAR